MRKSKNHQKQLVLKNIGKDAATADTDPGNSRTTDPDNLAGISMTDPTSTSDLMKSNSNEKPTEHKLDTVNSDDAQPDNSQAEERPEPAETPSRLRLDAIFGTPFVASSNAEVTTFRMPTKCRHPDCTATLHLKQSFDGFTYGQSEEDRVESELVCRNGHRTVAYFVEVQRRAMLSFALVADETSGKRIK
jgi:hypothetical protein